jgi:hypothetical protein
MIIAQEIWYALIGIVQKVFMRRLYLEIELSRNFLLIQILFIFVETVDPLRTSI